MLRKLKEVVGLSVSGGTMPEYRAYRIKDHHIDGPPEIIVSATDDKALERAKGLIRDHDIELWAGPRFVIGIKRPSQGYAKKKTFG
jgi:hypothetical protein